MTMDLREYTAKISGLAEKLQSYLDSQGEKLGFDEDARPARLFPQELQETRIALTSTLQDMSDLVEGAEQRMFWHPMLLVQDLAAYKLLYHYKLWTQVPEHGTIPYKEMAKHVKLEEKRLTAYVRYLITLRIFREPELGFVAHSASSRLLLKEEGLQCWLAACVDDQAEAAMALPETFDVHGLSLDPYRTTFNVARKDYSMNGMAVVMSDVKRGARYAKGFGWMATTQTGSNEVLLNSYPWEQFKLVVDVAGGNGNFSFALARKYPEMHCIIQDIAAQASYFKAPEDIADRLEYQVYDIFEQQPVKGDAYVFRTVLHCFGDDEKAADILRNTLPVMKPSSRIILVDGNTDLNAPSHWYRCQAGINAVMHCLGGKERTTEDWAKVIQMASPDLKLGMVVSPPGKAWSLIEIIPKQTSTGDVKELESNGV